MASTSKKQDAEFEALRAQYAIASYNDVRSEIRDRLGYRDKWIGQYVFGSVAFIGVSLGFEKIGIDTKILLCLVMPLTSLIVAINVSAHIRSIESCANFVRYKLDPLFAESGVSHWDRHTLDLRKAEDPDEIQRNKRRRMTNAVSLHLPSVISLFIATVFIRSGYKFSGTLDVPSPIFMYLISILVLILGVRITWKSLEDRLKVPEYAESNG